MSEKVLEQLRVYIAELTRELRKLLRSVETIEFISEQVGRIIRTLGVASDVATGKLVDRKVLAELFEELHNEIVQAGRAALGATKFSLVSKRNGGFIASIDDIVVELPPREGQLLAALAVRDGHSHDGLVPYKTWRHVRMQMATVPGVPISEHSLVVLLGRLRKRLHGKLHPAFIQADRVRGLRLALQIQPPGAPGVSARGCAAAPASTGATGDFSPNGWGHPAVPV